MSGEGERIREVVRAHYAEAAKRVQEVGGACGCACCGDTLAGSGDAASGGAGAGGGRDPVTRDLYGAADVATLPATAVDASLGCGNPVALADLGSGDVVLDLGSGGGIDVLLSARRVGPSGKAFGLDMTDEMLALARENQRKAGVANVEFLKGTIEEIPLPDGAVDVIISNCVINLSADKDRVLREAFRVLKPGGRFAVSDIVLRRPLPEPVRRSLELWAGCVVGALSEDEYRAKLAAAGFADATIQVTREYGIEDAREALGPDFLGALGLGAEDLASLDGAVVSAFVRARKPA